MCEIGDCDIFDGCDICNASVIDYDINLEFTTARVGKVVLGIGD